MEIKIKRFIKGAKEAEGLVVIIDVFRAFSLELYLMQNNVSMIIPVDKTSKAFKYKKENKNVLLVGEENGRKVEGFDYGNSPSEIEKIDFSGKMVVHRTSAGTQGIYNAKNADDVIVASLINAKAVCNYIKRQNPKTVTLVCMGNNGKTKAMEDELCALYIKKMLLNEEMDIQKEILDLKNKDGKKFFVKENQDIFPEKDFYLCTDVNKFNCVLKVTKNSEGFYTITKIDV